MAKLKVGDWANLVGSKLEGLKEPLTKVHILEVVTQQCESGIEQATYKCRVFHKDLKYGWAPATHEILFREMELEERNN